jgi:hypothetical protein
MRRKIVVIFLVLVLIPSFASCTQEPTPQEIIDGVIEAQGEISTYQFELDMTMYAVGEAEGEAHEQTITMDNSGTLDLENVQMEADLNMKTNIVAPVEEEIVMGVEMYIIDGMMYAKPEAPGEEPTWMKSELPSVAWEVQKGLSGLENYNELLATAQVEVIGSEKVKGVDCYVLEVTPDLEQLYQTAINPTGASGTGGMLLPPVPEELLQDIFSSFSVKQWVAKDTYLLMKTKIDMTIETTPELMDYLGEEVEVSMDINLTFLAYNYNEPVTIELPSEAEAAIEPPME